MASGTSRERSGDEGVHIHSLCSLNFFRPRWEPVCRLLENYCNSIKACGLSSVDNNSVASRKRFTLLQAKMVTIL